MTIKLTFRINRRYGAVSKLATGTRKAVSRNFNFTSETRINDLMQIKLKKKTEAKVDWAVSAYNDWRDTRLSSFQYDAPIYFADLLNIEGLEKGNLNHALCRFIPEVTKKRGDGPFPGATLYQMIIAIQKYLFVNKLKWKLMVSEEFEEMRNVLDNVMKERTLANVGVVKRQAGLISFEHEEKLWSQGILGEDTPDKLRDTVLFMIGINIHLRAIEEHYYLHRDMPEQKGQISFVMNPKGKKCVLYQEDFVTKTHDSGLRDMRRDRKIVWVYPNESDINKCPVRLIQKYLSLCPPYYKKPNFYLQSLSKPTPTQWYCEQVVGKCTIAKVVKSLMERAGIDGFFTNHSARRTGGTRLFRAGVDRKLVKEATGHTSDTVDKYQITSDEQREMMSNIIAGNKEPQVKAPSECQAVAKTIESTEGSPKCQCQCGKSENIQNIGNLNVSNISEVIDNVIKKQEKDGKTIIKISIEVIKE